ncbi:MAG TPA: LEA type 2 family protein [Steroidobacteraceae bacterium]|jgi:LEA14-like dessication related protein
MRKSARAWSYGWLLLLAIGSSGCASIAPRLEAPTLTITGVTIGNGNGQQQPVRLSFHATNPNNRAIAVRRIDCNLEVAGKAFAEGQTDGPFTLPPLGAVDFDLNVNANINAVLSALIGGLGNHSIDYRVYGRVLLQQGLMRTIPFDQQGKVRL